MDDRSPNLDDLIQAHRQGVHLTGEQRARNRARIVARVAAGTVASAIVLGASSSAAVAVPTAHSALSLLGKVAIGIAVLGGAGAAYQATRPAHLGVNAQRATDSIQQPTAASVPAAAAPVLPEEPAADLDAPVHRIPGDRSGVTPGRRATGTNAGTPSSLATEIRLMHEVEAALQAGQPERALQLLDERRGGFGAMREERAAARVVTLCKLGRVGEARAEGARFVHDWPRSPLVERVRSSCANGGESSGATGSK